MINYTLLTQEFNDLPNDGKRWEWIKQHQHLGITVNLDNDDTFATFDALQDSDEDIDCMQFQYYIGNAEGIEDMLSAFGIKSEGV